MNKLFIFNLVICLFLCLDYVHSFPPGAPKERIIAFKEMFKCSFENCEPQHNAFKALFKDELDGCLKKCNVLDNSIKALFEEDRMNLRKCFAENNCKMPSEHFKTYKETPQFKEVKKCSEEKCAEKYNKLKSLGGGESF